MRVWMRVDPDGSYLKLENERLKAENFELREKLQCVENCNLQETIRKLEEEYEKLMRTHLDLKDKCNRLKGAITKSLSHSIDRIL